ncbi:MAG: amidase [Saprospiraceae bacterium]|nr:amidase [Saprospiraceae bacterium]
MRKNNWKTISTNLFRISVLLSISWTANGQMPLPSIQDILDLHFTQSEIDSMRPNLSEYTENYRAIRQVNLPNEVAPVLYFNPLPAGFVPKAEAEPNVWDLPRGVYFPNRSQDLAYYSLHELSALVKARKITSENLTRFFISRLETYGDTLKCIITITDSLALSQARKADQEIDAGLYRGPLHGIPYGLKDLFAVPGYPTTWGAQPYRQQMINQEATVVKKLREAGAVLIGKLSMGALAWGDVWFGGNTLNPWDLSQGSSGSSAGSASAVAAGLVPFALGSETWGSIVSPATRCGVTGLRPTFGRVSRSGAMTLSWSMDKVGPLCRTAEDCAMVLDVIRGVDGIDNTLVEASFSYPIDVKKLKVAYFVDLIEKSPFRDADLTVINSLRKLGINPEPISFDINLPIEHCDFILNVEAAAAFDELTRTNRDDELVRQIRQSWPNVLRAARIVTAVEYIQANRVRNLLVQEMHTLLSEYDVIITPTFAGNQLLATNLTGQPVVVVPSAFHQGKPSASICFLGNLFEESKILALAQIYQEQQVPPVYGPPLFAK